MTVVSGLLPTRMKQSEKTGGTRPVIVGAKLTFAPHCPGSLAWVMLIGQLIVSSVTPVPWSSYVTVFTSVTRLSVALLDPTPLGVKLTVNLSHCPCAVSTPI